ncbi:MAG: alpha/beta hydrolase [Candidatus Paceibacterota bacterium]
MNKEIKIQGLKIKYKQKGKGTPILILHGWGGSSESWGKVIDIIAENKYMVICPDLPGFGESDNPEEPWTVNRYICFVLEFLKALEIDEFILLGHSFGGGLSTKITAEHPRIVQKLILCNAAVVRAKERLNIRQKVAKTSAHIMKPFLSNHFYKEKIQPKLRPVIYKIAGNYDYFSANETMKETFKKVFAEDLRAYAGYIKKPTLIIWGEKDKITPLEDAYTIKNIIDGSELDIIENVGHAPHLKKPEEISDLIIQFLNKSI